MLSRLINAALNLATSSVNAQRQARGFDLGKFTIVTVAPHKEEWFRANHEAVPAALFYESLLEEDPQAAATFRKQCEAAGRQYPGASVWVTKR